MTSNSVQCAAIHKSTKERCKRRVSGGDRLCAVHGGLSQREKVKMMSKVGTEILQFIQPIPSTHPLANPINGFYDTWLYNEGRIAFLKDRIAKFDDEQDLVWGKTKEENVSATEFPGTNTTYETKKSIWVLMLDEAIEQRIKLLALAAKLGIEKAKLESAQGLKSQTISVILNTLKRLGYDAGTDLVKEAIREAIHDAQSGALRGTPAERVIPQSGGGFPQPKHLSE